MHKTISPYIIIIIIIYSWVTQTYPHAYVCACDPAICNNYYYYVSFYVYIGNFAILLNEQILPRNSLFQPTTHP